MRRLAALFAVLLLAVAAMALDVGDTVGISVRETELRSSAGFLSRTLATLLYLDEVVIVSTRGDWFEVEVSESREKGWIHSSSVAGTKELQLVGGGRSTTGTTTNREIALAGRGFNEQVEEQIKTDEDLDFSLVDEMETYILDAPTAAEFLIEAGLEPDEGGAQ